MDMIPQKRQLPKLMACMTKGSLDNLRNKMLFTMDMLDAKGIRRRQKPLHECLILELGEQGYVESANYLQDLLYDNMQLVAQDDIGIVVDLTKREDFLEHISTRLQIAERERERDNTKKECLTLLNLALHYIEQGKGILWLAEKFFLASIATASRYMLDGGRLKGVAKYHYAKFLLDKFPAGDPDEPFEILTAVRDSSIGKVSLLVNVNKRQPIPNISISIHTVFNEKNWPLYEPERDGEVVPTDSLFGATAVQLHRVLLNKARAIRKTDVAKSERLSRLAERRGQDTGQAPLVAEAIIEVGICQLMMNNLNNARKTFERAFKINTEINYIEGLCITRMHLAAVMQRLGDHETAARLLTEMGALAMEHGLRRQLGRALHLLGELHLRRERPELGSHHLAEAFYCFMGVTILTPHRGLQEPLSQNTRSTLGIIFTTERVENYPEEADQSRLMMAVSKGQEHMTSYYTLLRESKDCSVSTMKCIEWKLNKNGWWIHRLYHELLPCMCRLHNRTPLDVLRHQLDLRARAERIGVVTSTLSECVLDRGDSIKDFKELMDLASKSQMFEKSASVLDQEGKKEEEAAKEGSKGGVNETIKEEEPQ